MALVGVEGLVGAVKGGVSSPVASGIARKLQGNPSDQISTFTQAKAISGNLSSLLADPISSWKPWVAPVMVV